jgi:murein DD-endopeptidase MepM/ murein hydrolase activator NlpD
LQDSHHQRGIWFFRRVWLIIAGVLLLGHTPVLADSYIRVYKKGVLYYYFPIRKHPQLSQTGMNLTAWWGGPSSPLTLTTLPEGQAFTPVRKQPQDLRALIIEAAIRMEAKRHVEATPPKGAQDLRELRQGKGHDLPVANFFASQENIGPGLGYLDIMLGKCGYHSPLAAVLENHDSRRIYHHQVFPLSQETKALVREVCSSFLQYAREQHAPLGPRKPNPDRFAESNHIGYCFPVAWPYSFRDTWGDPRPGRRSHHAVDIFAGEGTPVFAITAGVIHKLANWPKAGITLLLRGQDGRGYGYMHLRGYAEGIAEGKTVKQGELIAYVGHTGLLWEPPHLHLQVYVDHRFERDEFVNPYNLLVQLCNGIGVIDLPNQIYGRRRIPEIEVTRYGKMTLYSFRPRRRKLHQSVEDASTLLTNYPLKKDYLTIPTKQIP